MAEEIDEETRRFITVGYERALSILRQHKVQLDAMAEALLIREVLDAKDIQRILEGEQIITDDERKTYAEAQKRHEDERKSIKAASAERAKAALGASLTPAVQGT
jgi:hypothetical protein